MQSLLYTFKGKKMTAVCYIFPLSVSQQKDHSHLFSSRPCSLFKYDWFQKLPHHLHYSCCDLKPAKGWFVNILVCKKYIIWLLRWYKMERFTTAPLYLSCFCFRFELLQFVRYTVTAYIPLSLQHLLFNLDEYGQLCFF